MDDPEHEATLAERAAVGWDACVSEFDAVLENGDLVETTRPALDRYSRWLAWTLERHPEERSTLAPYREAVVALRMEAAVRHAHQDGYATIAKLTLARLKAPRGKYGEERQRQLERLLDR